MANPKNEKWRKMVKGRIQEAMYKSGASAYKIGNDLGISKNGVYYILSSKCATPSTEMIYKLCKYLGVSADWVLGLDNKEPFLSKKYADMLANYKAYLCALQRREDRRNGNDVGTMEPEETAANEPVRAGTAGDGTGHQRDGGQDS